ncbi:glycosyl transferase family protein [Aspergillus egyptiacus]|nr:glycosyl transferase family protein [Aspergillus egyptiacus]
MSINTNNGRAATKVWTTLITNTDYLPGLLTLEYSLRRVGSKYPLLVLYTDSFPADGHAALDARKIMKKCVPYLLPSTPKDFVNDTRFYDCWSKLTPFSLVEYERVVQLDSDMLILQNMDELMDLELDPPALAGTGNRVFAAAHACACNPLHKPHYPENWIPSNCAYTTQHAAPSTAQTTGAPAIAGLGIPNGGLQVVNPSREIYDNIIARLATSATSAYDFADQSLLADMFHGRWVPLPYVYNALKTLRWKGVHDALWKDENVKNIHYILSPKPWDEDENLRSEQGDVQPGRDSTHEWWWALNRQRLEDEKANGLHGVDG